MKLKRFVLSEFQVNNYLLVQGKEAVLIDIGYNPTKIKDYILSNELELKGILLTHAHLDHIGGINEVREAFNAPVYIHHNEKEWLVNPELNGSNSFSFFGEVKTKPADKIIYDEKELDIGSFHFKVIYTPGHTPGGLSYYIDKWVFTGDTLFYHSIGRTDLYGGDQGRLIKSIKERLFVLPNDTVVYPGHEEKTSIGEEKKENPFL